MDPLGNITEGIQEDEISRNMDQHFEIDPQILNDNRKHEQKMPLIKRFFNEDKSNSLRRTSSFMLRSRKEGGGKIFLIDKYSYVEPKPLFTVSNNIN